jgi:hypothetical protein
MGNRGILHDAQGRLGRARWRHPHWIACRLEFRGRRRPIMAPHSYTELFFLDEVVGLAAGHRPCAECRRDDYDRFLDCWQAVTGERPRASALDRVLHQARNVRGSRTQATCPARLRDQPDGTFVSIAGAPCLVFAGLLYPFAPGGYGSPLGVSAVLVDVLTPAPIVRVLRAGYRPEVHPSAPI